MSLSCDCGFDDYEWYYNIDEVERVAMTDFYCYGCREFHKSGEHVRRVLSYEMDEDGNEVNWQYIGRLCEVCAGLYDSLSELGYCLTADFGFVADAMDEYRVMAEEEQRRARNKQVH